MGGISSSNPLVGIATKGLDSITGLPIASTALGVAGTLSAQRQQEQAAQSAYERNLSLMEMQKDRQERQRRNLLKRAQAEQRARLGAFGMGASGGSGDALLAGLAQDAATDLADMQWSFDTRKQEMDEQMGQRRNAMRQQHLGQNIDMVMKVGRGFNIL